MIEVFILLLEIDLEFVEGKFGGLPHYLLAVDLAGRAVAVGSVPLVPDVHAVLGEKPATDRVIGRGAAWCLQDEPEIAIANAATTRQAWGAPGGVRHRAAAVFMFAYAKVAVFWGGTGVREQLAVSMGLAGRAYARFSAKRA